MIRAVSGFFVAGAVAFSAPTLAQNAPPVSAPAKQEPGKLDPNERVCERQEVIGSRIASRRICMTRAEWADRKLQDRQELERVQTQRGSKTE